MDSKLTIVFQLLLVVKISISDQTHLIVAKDNGLISVNLTSHAASTLLSRGIPNTIDFLHDSHGNYQLFWSDLQYQSIYSGIINEGRLKNTSSLLSLKSGSIDGIAIDWIAGNIYWIASELELIEVATIEGKFRSALLTGLSHPRSLAIDPLKSVLFWSERKEDALYIESCSLSGRRKRRVFDMVGTKGGRINALTLDHSVQKIYWITTNSYFIHSLSYDGHDHQEISQQNYMILPKGIDVYGNKIFWSDDEEINRVFQIESGKKNSATIIYETYSDINQIKILHPRSSTNKANPCVTDNGGCSHLCLPEGNFVRCHCAYGHVLSVDNKTCITERRAMGVIFEFDGAMPKRKSLLFRQNLGNPSQPLFPCRLENKRYEIQGLDYDPSSDVALLLDTKNNEILLHDLQGNTSKLIEVLPETNSVAKDYKSGDIYLGVGGKAPQIAQCSHLSHVCVPVVSENVSSPSDVTVQSRKKQLLWTDRSKDTVIIESLVLDGTKRSVIATGSDLCCLTVDVLSEDIYWIDRKTNCLWWKSGNLIQTVCSIYPKSFHPRSLSVSGEVAYVASGRNIIIYNKTDSSMKLVPFRSTGGHIIAMKVFIPEEYLETIPASEDTSIVPFTQESLSNEPATNVTELPLVDNRGQCRRRCLNSGRCVKSSTGRLSCYCQPGTWGTMCQFNLCQFCKHGSCDADSKRECRCDRGFTGVNCELLTCENYCINGNCSLLYGVPDCTCSEGWSGLHCNRSDTCYDWCFSKRKDVDQGKIKYCNCEAELYGDSYVGQDLIIDIAAAMVILLVIFIIIFLIHKGQSCCRKKDNTSDQSDDNENCLAGMENKCDISDDPCEATCTNKECTVPFSTRFFVYLKKSWAKFQENPKHQKCYYKPQSQFESNYKIRTVPGNEATAC